jgi:preprotein translocase subunit Sec61beta
MEEPKPPARPGWVIGLGIAVLILLIIAVILMFVIPGEHGPGRHM